MRLNTEPIHTIYLNDCFVVVFGSQIMSQCLPWLGSSSYFWRRNTLGASCHELSHGQTAWERAEGLPGCWEARQGPPHLHPLPFMAKAVLTPCICTGAALSTSLPEPLCQESQCYAWLLSS